MQYINLFVELVRFSAKWYDNYVQLGPIVYSVLLELNWTVFENMDIWQICFKETKLSK